MSTHASDGQTDRQTDICRIRANYKLDGGAAVNSIGTSSWRRCCQFGKPWQERTWGEWMSICSTYPTTRDHVFWSLGCPFTRMSPVISPCVFRPAMTSIRVVLPAPAQIQAQIQAQYQLKPSAEAVRVILSVFQVLTMQQDSTRPLSACLIGSYVAVFAE